MWIRSLAHMAQMVFQWQLAAPWQFAENEVTSKASKSIYFYLILYICICILTMTSLKGKKPPFTLHILSVVAVLPRLAIFGPGSLALAPDTVEGRFLGGAAAFFPPFHHCHCQTIAKNIRHQIILSYGNHLWNWLVWKIPQHQQFFFGQLKFGEQKCQASLKGSGGMKSFTTRWVFYRWAVWGGGAKVSQKSSQGWFLSWWWVILEYKFPAFVELYITVRFSGWVWSFWG